ncbi:hypothetical protein [Nonomuraea pusilla]|uniref:Uncharacterized protein n=1 Tax=Nonomuraea pusilla TaxID=46177 RepID=A0A1H7WBT9_9ACTN|nr:hypothetical protein [Nonomuraea pusilla]SEM19026.1 hypothetical protein SAMN05660976_04452 [Nonomuraea pusilla]
MLAISLGTAWLLLGPLSLWALLQGRTAARAGAVVTLLLLEAATFAMDRARPAPASAPVAASAAPAAAPPSCQAVRTPVPLSAKVGKALVLTWTAVPDECGTAKVVVRPEGRRLLIWVHEGPLTGEHEGMHTVPVRVERGAAALTVPLTGPLPGKAPYIPVDGRSGRRIPRA